MKTIKTKSGRSPVTSPILKFLVWAFLIALVVTFASGAFGAQIPNGATTVLKVAADLVASGYHEGPNKSTIFGEWYGLDHQSWCAMCLSWCFNEAGLGKLVAAQSEKGFASCAIGLRWFRQNKQLVQIEDARPGDIVFYRFGNDGKTHHVGLLSENHLDKGYVVCYEGNTTSGIKGSQRDGGGVYRRERSYGLIMAVARPRYE